MRELYDSDFKKAHKIAVPFFHIFYNIEKNGGHFINLLKIINSFSN